MCDGALCAFFACPHSLVGLAPIRESGPISVADLLDFDFGIRRIPFDACGIRVLLLLLWGPKRFERCLLSPSRQTTCPAISSARSNFPALSILNSVKSLIGWKIKISIMRCSLTIAVKCMLWQTFCGLKVIYWRKVGKVSATKPISADLLLRSLNLASVL